MAAFLAFMAKKERYNKLYGYKTMIDLLLNHSDNREGFF